MLILPCARAGCRLGVKPLEIAVASVSNPRNPYQYWVLCLARRPSLHDDQA